MFFVVAITDDQRVEGPPLDSLAEARSAAQSLSGLTAATEVLVLRDGDPVPLYVFTDGAVVASRCPRDQPPKDYRD
jgi:hypothetical protein